MTEILALDLATTTGWCRGEVGDAIPHFGTVKFISKGHYGGDDAFAAALDWMIEMKREWRKPPDILILESMLPPEAMRNQTSRQVRDRLAGLHGVVRGMSSSWGVGEITEVAVGDVRKHFVGTRVLRRIQAKKAVIERCRALGWNVANDNEADACAIWSFAVSIIDPKQALRVSPLFNRDLRVMT
jgi:hypothetical protein